MKIIFAGTPAFAAESLKTLMTSSHEVVAVYTQPDRPSGRGQRLTASPVKELAIKQGIPVQQPSSLKPLEAQAMLANFNADLMVVVAYGLILPRAILTTPRLGCLNIHASLLPQFRGAAPIQRAILAGLPKTGITIMQMEAGLDTGPMLYKLECPIHANDTTASLHDRLAKLGSEAIVYTLTHLATLIPEKQDDRLATYAAKISKEEAKIDWQQSAEDIALQVRAFNPWPIAYTSNFRIWEAAVLQEEVNTLPGVIVATCKEGVTVATGKYCLQIKKLQFPGGRVLSAADVLNSPRPELAIGQKID